MGTQTQRSPIEIVEMWSRMQARLSDHDRRVQLVGRHRNALVQLGVQHGIDMSFLYAWVMYSNPVYILDQLELVQLALAGQITAPEEPTDRWSSEALSIYTVLHSRGFDYPTVEAA
jgi:hypothetical protein